VCEERDDDYFGLTVNRVARLESIAHGGQIVCSGVTRDLIGRHVPDHVTLVDMGDHRLKDLARAERVWQVDVAGLPNGFAPLRSLSNPRLQTNLVPQPTSFVGREREIEEIVGLLLLDGTGDGVWLCELAPVGDPGLVVSTVLRVLEIREDPSRDALEHFVDVCADRDMLLILDNAEHVIDAVAKFADQCARQCHRVQLIVTSREPLEIDGERVFDGPVGGRDSG
jgi:hypothetical protein